MKYFLRIIPIAHLERVDFTMNGITGYFYKPIYLNGFYKFVFGQKCQPWKYFTGTNGLRAFIPWFVYLVRKKAIVTPRLPLCCFMIENIKVLIGRHPNA